MLTYESVLPNTVYIQQLHSLHVIDHFKLYQLVKKKGDGMTVSNLDYYIVVSAKQFMKTLLMQR